MRASLDGECDRHLVQAQALAGCTNLASDTKLVRWDCVVAAQLSRRRAAARHASSNADAAAAALCRGCMGQHATPTNTTASTQHAP